jgi:hypothetical protein
MPQDTNLNISPYFDDFNPESNYFRFLFKPGTPIQARELTSLQSTLQNQIERFANSIYKDGDVVIPGQVNHLDRYQAVTLQDVYLGIPVISYLPYLVGKTIRGQSSGIRAKVDSVLDYTNSERGLNTLYINFLSSDYANSKYDGFINGEVLIIESGLEEENILDDSTIILRPGEGFAITDQSNCNATGSAVSINEGVYYLRGHFVYVNDDTILLDQYQNNGSYKVGFQLLENVITSDEDPDLLDNAQGYQNYAAPGADRLQISAFLTKVPLDADNPLDFVELLQIRQGILVSLRRDPRYSEIAKEFARRTYEESGDYYVRSPIITLNESLNDFMGNEGVFIEGQTTYNNNTPADDLGIYQVSALKALVQGYSVETISPTFIDFEKPRETNTLESQGVNYVTGPTFTVNRVSGNPLLGISTSYYVSLRDSRVGTSLGLSGKEIGVARVYDFALESGSYESSTPNANEWDLSLYDIQTYTEITLNEPITLSRPTHVKGKSSGSTGFIRYDVTNSPAITVYNTKGKFANGERFIFDGIENTRVSIAVTEYGLENVKSVHASVAGIGFTFTADVKQRSVYSGNYANITTGVSGVSTVTAPGVKFAEIASVGDIISYSNPGFSDITYSVITQVNPTSLRISGVTTVSGVCSGALPASSINISDFKILKSGLQRSTDNTLYTTLPKKYVSSVDLSGSLLTIRKQFDVTITSNSTQTIIAGDGETFLPFDEERYSLSINGTIEVLTEDRLVFSNGSTELTIRGLQTSSGSGKLIATLVDSKVESKSKTRNRIESIVVDKSSYEYSGIGTQTSNDGLTFGNYAYGTRVQDEEICLLRPDVIKIYGIYESSSTSDPILPRITVSGLTGPTSKTIDLFIGEKIIGQSSNSIAIYCERVNDSQITFTSLNGKSFEIGEQIKFEESGITGFISEFIPGDRNITSNFIFDNGQKDTIYDYSKIVRRPEFRSPTRRIKIILESSSIPSSDVGDILTVNSYSQFDYCDIPSINGIRVSDLIDIRPRVSNIQVTTSTYSPFEFFGRTFNYSASNKVLASDEAITLGFSYYLPRIDKIFITKEGTLQLRKGEPADIPNPPTSVDSALEVATITLPPYLCDVNDATINLTEHKRYRMSDIRTLENRIKNLEYYTSLTLLESDTSSLQIQDANGLNRFKSGFFVDDFKSTTSQRKVTYVKNSIDVKNSEIRPAPFTTSLDLIIGSKSLVGIGSTVNPNVDISTVNDLIANNIRKSGQIVTLDFDEVEAIRQPYSTRVEPVASYRSPFYGGTIELYPSSDVWVDQVRIQANVTQIQGNLTETKSQISIGDLDKQTGFSPVIWGAWETVWTGQTKDTKTRVFDEGFLTYQEITDTITRTGTSTRTGTRSITRDSFETVSYGDRVISTELTPFMRSRNIEFTAKRLKPSTRLYAFFDGLRVSEYVIPKLLEITMTSGTFSVGETVIGTVATSEDKFASSTNPSLAINPKISFRVAVPNHKYGPYNAPIDTYNFNPYTRLNTLGSQYSQTSTILNIDTFSLSTYAIGSFHGWVKSGMKLVGQTSGAIATVNEVKLISDDKGTLVGSFWIPNPNVPSFPSFKTGTKIFKLTSSESNTQIEGIPTTGAEERFVSDGRVDTVQENVISIRTVRSETQTVIDNVSASQTQSPVVTKTLIADRTPPPPPPVLPGDPLPQPQDPIQPEPPASDPPGGGGGPVQEEIPNGNEETPGTGPTDTGGTPGETPTGGGRTKKPKPKTSVGFINANGGSTTNKLGLTPGTSVPVNLLNGKAFGFYVATQGKDKAEKLWRQAGLKVTSNDRATSGLANGLFPITKKGYNDLDITSRPKGQISTANSGFGIINAISNLNPNSNVIEAVKLNRQQGYTIKRSSTYGPSGANITVGNALIKKPNSNNNNNQGGANKNTQNQNRSSGGGGNSGGGGGNSGGGGNNNSGNNSNNKDRNNDKKNKRR